MSNTVIPFAIEDFSSTIGEVTPLLDPFHVVGSPTTGLLTIVYPLLADTLPATEAALATLSVSPRFVFVFEMSSDFQKATPIIVDHSLIIPIDIPEGTVFNFYTPNEGAVLESGMNRVYSLADCTLDRQVDMTKPVLLTRNTVFHAAVPEGTVYKAICIHFNEDTTQIF